jgi:hypothetical protein
MPTVPKFAGMSGQLLSRTVTATATVGFLLFGYDRMSRNPLCGLRRKSALIYPTEGVMSSIIDSEAFFRILPELDGNSTMQGTVTALYEIGTCRNIK